MKEKKISKNTDFMSTWTNAIRQMGEKMQQEKKTQEANEKKTYGLFHKEELIEHGSLFYCSNEYFNRKFRNGQEDLDIFEIEIVKKRHVGEKEAGDELEKILSS